MTFGFDFHPEARAELFADVDWYDEREVGLASGSRLPCGQRSTRVGRLAGVLGGLAGLGA